MSIDVQKLKNYASFKIRIIWEKKNWSKKMEIYEDLCKFVESTRDNKVKNKA